LHRVIELAILGILKEGAMHGYELRKRLHELVGTRPAASFGSIYPALGRLERNGEVAVVAATALPGPMPPMTGSFTGEAAAFRASRRSLPRAPRNKKVYAITDRGSARLAEIIADPADDDRSFPVKVALCRFVDPETRVGLLERRRAALVERLGEGRRTIGQRGDRIDRYLRSLLEHDTEATERDIAWLDRLLTAERELPAPAIHATPIHAPAIRAPEPPATDASAPPPAAASRAAYAAAPTLPSRPARPPQQPSISDGDDTAHPADGGSR
jgi:DNA-binding PadR family transcriptional regulator